MKRSRRWLIIASVALSLVLLLVYIALTAFDAAMPKPAPADLKQRTPVTTRPLVDAADDVTGNCTLTVTAKTWQGSAAEDVDVRVTRKNLLEERLIAQGTTGEDGVLVFANLECAVVQVASSHPSLTAGRPQERVLKPGYPQTVELWLESGLRIEGTVRGPDGRGIDGATVRWSGATKDATVTNASGDYQLIVTWPEDTDQAYQLRAKAFGYEMREPHTVELEDDEHWGDEDDDEMMASTTLTIDLDMVKVRALEVYCAGLEDDLCTGIVVLCTQPLLPIGNLCTTNPRTGVTECNCFDRKRRPLEGKVAIRGAGVVSLAEPDDTKVWLDFRDSGSIQGFVTLDGQTPGMCQLAGARLPSSVIDASTKLASASMGACEADGSFEIKGLAEGDWEIIAATSDPELGQVFRVMPPVEVRNRQTTDMGTIEIMDAGTIEGRVIDGLTGAPEPRKVIIAMRPDEAGGRSTQFFGGSDEDGRFEIQGLSAGSWTLRLAHAPHIETTVAVDEGAITDGVVLEDSAAPALETNGFTLVTDGSELYVDEVQEGSPAEQAGLRPDDRVAGILVAGVDISSYLGDRADMAVQLLLGHYGGPGVTLVVDRDGSQLEVPLDW